MSQNGDLNAVFSLYRVADYLTTPSELAAYLKAAREEDDPELLTAAIEDIRQIEQGKTGSVDKPYCPQAKPTA